MTVTPPTCPYCGQSAVPATGEDIYPHRPDLYALSFFQCAPCGAYVGTHRETGEPLGTPAKAELRRLRNEAHAAFDPVWKQLAGREYLREREANKKRKKGSKLPVNAIGFHIKQWRTAAYTALAKAMDISVENCHIAVFTEDQCRKVIQLCTNRELKISL